MQRRHHYEQAFEHYVRLRRLPYVAVHEARKALLPAVVGGPAARQADISPELAALKSFDFVLYGSAGNLLAEVKGRKLAGRKGASARLESWVTQDDIASLSAWERLFGAGFQAAFIFVYWCDHQPALPLFEELFAFKERWYAIRTITLRDYARAMRPRSPKWGTVHMPTAEFDRASRSLCGPSGAWAPSPA